MKESFCGGHDIRQIWNIVKKRMISFETDKDQRKQFREYSMIWMLLLPRGKTYFYPA